MFIASVEKPFSSYSEILSAFHTGTAGVLACLVPPTCCGWYGAGEDACGPSICIRHYLEKLLKGRAGFANDLNELFRAFSDHIGLAVANRFDVD